MIDYITSQCGWVDIILAVFLITGGAVGIKNGLLKEIPKFISIYIAVILTMHFYERLGDKMASNSFLPPLSAEMIAFILIVLASFLACRFLFRIFEALITVSCARPLDVGGGLLLGIIRYCLIFSLISYWLLMLTSNYIQESYSAQSFSGPFLSEVCEKVYCGTVTVLPFLKNI